jgi:hypothetical protein
MVILYYWFIALSIRCSIKLLSVRMRSGADAFDIAPLLDLEPQEPVRCPATA